MENMQKLYHKYYFQSLLYCVYILCISVDVYFFFWLVLLLLLLFCENCENMFEAKRFIQFMDNTRNEERKILIPQAFCV